MRVRVDNPMADGRPPCSEDGLYPAPHPGVEWCCDAMWALSDFTEANGATHIVKNSHKAPRDAGARVGYEHTAQAVMLARGESIIL